MEKKPFGWRREPARHALASKGIETGRTQRHIANRGALVLSPEARRSRVPGIDDQVKERCADQVIVRALRESNGDEKAALVLLESDAWLKVAIKDAAQDGGKGILQRGSLEQELLRSFRKEGAVVEQDSGDHEERA